MHHEKKLGPIRLVSSIDNPRPQVSRWIPQQLQPLTSKKPVDPKQRSLDEITDDLAALSRQAGEISQLLDRTEGLQQQSLFHLAKILEHELTELLAIAQSLQPK